MALPPGPTSSALTQTVHLVRGPAEFLTRCARDYGDVFTVKVWNPNRRVRIVFAWDPATIKQVFTTAGDTLRAGEAARGVIGPFVGDYSLLTLDGPEHRRQRKLLMPPFHGERMRAYGETMRAITEAKIASWPRGEPFAVHGWMQQITLEVILRTVFGMEDGASMDRLGGELTAVMNVGRNPLSMLPLSRVWMGPRSPRAQFERHKAAADELIFAEIERRRASANGAPREDVLSLMMSAVDEDGAQMTNQELRDELVTMLAAGHETTATALAWAIAELLGHRHTLERAVAELDTVTGGAPVTAENLARLEYLDAVCKETLRLRPIVPKVARVLQVPLVVRGFELPARTVLAPSIYLTHRHPDIYPEPESFRPERWLGVKPDPYAWLPFGGGVRRCLGMAFAMFEMKIVLATVLQRAALSLAPGTSSRLARRAITFAPSDGARVVAHAR